MNSYQIISASLAAAVFIGSAWGWARVAQRLSSGQPLLRFVVRRPVPWSFGEVILLLLFTVGVNSILLLALSLGGVDVHLDANSSPIQQATGIGLFSLSELIALPLTLMFTRWRTGATARDLGWVPRFRDDDVLLGITAFLILAVPVFLLQLALTKIWDDTTHPLIELLQSDSSTKFFLFTGFAAVVVAPIVEEFLFRVLLQGWLEKIAFLRRRPLSANNPPLDAGGNETAMATYSPPENFSAHASQLIDQPSWWPIAISALLFSLAHFAHGPAPIPLFFLALGLGYVYQRTHRVLPCIVIHMLVNSWSLVQLWLYVHASK